MSKRQDRGVRKTKQALRDALGQLLISKDINEISIKELTELADVNRGTFYFHYADIYDFLDKIGDDIILEIEVLFKELTPEQKEKGLAYIFDGITQKFINAPSGAPLLMRDSGLSILRKISVVIRDNYFLEWLQEYTNNDNKQELIFFSDFLISGYFTLVIQWMNTENSMPKNEFIEKLDRICMQGIGFLMKK